MMSDINRKTCSSYEAYFTIGSVRGYHGEDISKDELISEIGNFQKEFEIKNGYCCGVRIIQSMVLFQSYFEECYDVHVINYPRFPMSENRIELFIRTCVEHLLEALDQERIAIFFPDVTVMLEREGADESRLHDKEEE